MELELCRKEGLVSAREMIPLLANHAEYVECHLEEGDDSEASYVKRVWDLVGEVCVAAREEKEEEEDEQQEEEEAADEEGVKPMTLAGMLEMRRPCHGYRSCWYRGEVANAAKIADLPLGWEVEYRMYEGLPQHRSDKATAVYRGNSYVECFVTDPMEGRTLNLKEATRESGRGDGDVVSVNGIGFMHKLHERTWWLHKFQGNLPTSVVEMLERGEGRGRKKKAG